MKLTWHLKMDGWKTSLLLGWLPGRCYVSFREDISCHTVMRENCFFRTANEPTNVIKCPKKKKLNLAKPQWRIYKNPCQATCWECDFFPSHSEILSKRYKRTKCLGLSLGVFWALKDGKKAWITSDPCVDMPDKNSLQTSSLHLACVGVRWRLCLV